MSYLVMECHPGYAILLDEAGRFLRAANLNYQVGQRVYEPVLMRERPEKRSGVFKWVSGGVAALAACLVLLFGLQYYQNYMTTYSSIYMSINPSVQMDLNRRGQVIELEGANEDGDALIDGYDGRGKDKLTVAEELIDRAVDMGFLSEGGQVSFSIDAPDEALFQEYGMELRAGVTEYLESRITVTIEIVSFDEAQNAPEQENPQPEEPQEPQPETPPIQEPEEPQTPPQTGSSDYGDTDYSPGGEAEADTPAIQQPVDTDYGPDSDGVTDYTDGETDYSPGNQTGGTQAGDSGYGDSAYGGGSGYSEGGDNDDNDDGDSVYDDDDD